MLTWGDVHYLLTDMHQRGGAGKAFRSWAEKAGHDGISHIGGWNIGAKEHRVWIAWEPTQIKATAAKEFDPMSDDIYKGPRLFIPAELCKAEQLGLFGAPAKPAAPKAPKAPQGFTPIPGSKRGGYHKREGAKFVYWYPDTGIVHAPHPADEAGQALHRQAEAEQQAQPAGEGKIKIVRINPETGKEEEIQPGAPKPAPAPAPAPKPEPKPEPH